MECKIMLKFVHKRINTREHYFPDCPKSKALLKLFGFDSIIGKEGIDLLQTIMPIEIYEMPNRELFDPYKRRRKKDA